MASRSRAALRGSFRKCDDDGYVHVWRRHPPHVVIGSSGRFLILNYADEARTRELYGQIVQVREGQLATMAIEVCGAVDRQTFKGLRKFAVVLTGRGRDLLDENRRYVFLRCGRS